MTGQRQRQVAIRIDANSDYYRKTEALRLPTTSMFNVQLGSSLLIWRRQLTPEVRTRWTIADIFRQAAEMAARREGRRTHL